MAMRQIIINPMITCYTNNDIRWFQKVNTKQQNKNHTICYVFTIYVTR